MMQLIIDAKAYSLDAVKRTLYELGDLISGSISYSNNSIVVDLIVKDSRYHESNFWDTILDQQLQIDLEQKYYMIRNIIVAQAIAPKGDINLVVEQLNAKI